MTKSIIAIAAAAATLPFAVTTAHAAPVNPSHITTVESHIAPITASETANNSRYERNYRYNDRSGTRYYNNRTAYNDRYYNDRRYSNNRYNDRRYNDRRYNDRYYNDRRYNDRYYDDRRRSDGTTGTIIGGLAGAAIGSAVAGRGNRTEGALIGGLGGAIIGRTIDKNNSRDRYYRHGR